MINKDVPCEDILIQIKADKTIADLAKAVELFSRMG